MGEWLAARTLFVVQSMWQQILWVALPLAIFALTFHAIEWGVQRRLVQRFGWRAALWTGWIGTPIHEFSHVVGCWVFGHEIESMALFEPDNREGRLGYVRHTYHRGNWWQEAGNFFIGVAPLLGGGLTLMLLTWAMYPGVVRVWLEWGATSVNAAGVEPTASWSVLKDDLVQVFYEQRYPFGARLWLYLYLVLCVSLHMAPSGSDYRGGMKGGVILLILWLSLNLLHGAVGLSLNDWFPVVGPLWQLALALMVLAGGLAGIVTGGVYAGTLAWDGLRRT